MRLVIVELLPLFLLYLRLRFVTFFFFYVFRIFIHIIRICVLYQLLALPYIIKGSVNDDFPYPPFKRTAAL